jgi:chemotaxis protein MotB
MDTVFHRRYLINVLSSTKVLAARTTPLIQKYPGSAQRVKIINNDLGRVKALLEERLYGPEKFPEKGKTGLERVVSVERTQKGFKLQLMARHFFEPGEYQVRRGAMSELNQVGQILMDLGRPIVIEGHTDSIPATGKYSNWELSSLRAASVGKYFVRQLNFPTSKMSVAGYADLRPVAPNTTDAGRAANRRIEIQVDYDPEVSSE